MEMDNVLQNSMPEHLKKRLQSRQEKKKRLSTEERHANAVQRSQEALDARVQRAIETRPVINPTMAQETKVDGVTYVQHPFVPDPFEDDEEGYAPSFYAEQGAELKEFFKRFGFVVIRDALSSVEVAATKQDIFEQAKFPVDDNGARRPPGLAELDEINWDGVSGSRYNTKRGFLGYDPSWSVTAWLNRLNPKLHSANACLFGRRDLIVKLDRYGLMRPTKFLTNSARPVQERPAWKTEGAWIHWDQNPWLEPDFVRIQCVIAVSDHRKDAGGFHCVPGFTHQWKAWAAANSQRQCDATLFEVPAADLMRPFLQRVCMRPGSAVLWDSRTPHGNFPVESDNWRLCQYAGFHPAPTDNQPGIRKNRETIMANWASYGRLGSQLYDSPTKARLLGFESWGSEQGATHTISRLSMAQLNLSDDVDGEADAADDSDSELYGATADDGGGFV